MISTNIPPRDEWTALQDEQRNNTSLSTVWRTVRYDESGVNLTYHCILPNNTVTARNSKTAPPLKLRQAGFSLIFTFTAIQQKQKSQLLLIKTFKQWYIYPSCWRTWLISSQNYNFLIKVSLVTAYQSKTSAMCPCVPYPLPGNSLNFGGK